MGKKSRRRQHSSNGLVPVLGAPHASGESAGIHLELSKHIYLTLVALIQTLAVSELVREIPALSASTWAFRLECLSDLQMIILTWNEYMANMMRTPGWTVGALDSYVPFLLGVTEVGVVYGTHSRNFSMWSGWTSAFMGFGVLAFINLYSHTGRDLEHRLTPKPLLDFRELNLAVPALGAIAFAVLAYVFTSGITENTKMIVMLAINAYWLGFLGRSLFMWSRFEERRLQRMAAAAETLADGQPVRLQGSQKSDDAQDGVEIWPLP